MMNIEIGKKIRLLRLSKGLTQEQLAEKLRVTAQSVSKWENDVTAPDIALLPQISVELGVTIDELFSITDEVRLQRIEKLLEKSSMNTIISGNDFEAYRVFLTELKGNSKLRGRALTALACLYNLQASVYRANAAKAANEAIEEDPYNKSNHSCLCAAMIGADRDWYAANHHELIDYYIEFIKRYPDNIPALQLLLDNLIADNRAEEACMMLEKLKKCDKSCRALWYEAQILSMRGDNACAENTLERMTAEFSDDWLAWSYRGDFYARNAEYDKAVECWKRGHELQQRPRLTDNLLCLAAVSVINRDFSKAAEYYSSTVELLKEDHNMIEGDITDYYNDLAMFYSGR